MDQRLDPFNGKYGKLLQIEELGHKDYIHTEYSFNKRQPLRVAQGGPTGWKWGPQRLHNEASAVRLAGAKTTIPVPRVLEEGYDTAGLYYVTFQRVAGVALLKIGDKCRQAVESVSHATSGPCSACQQIAESNANAFIRTTGLDAFLLPAPRIIEIHDDIEYRPVKTSHSEIYNFIHGDLARQNVMMDPETLQVRYIFDWEHGGYLPSEMERELWCAPGANNSGYHAYFRNKELIKSEIELITPYIGSHASVMTDYKMSSAK